MTASSSNLSPVGTLLRRWRDARGRSQLQLALDMGVSQRHVSFIESGRSSPSRALLLGLGVVNLVRPGEGVTITRTAAGIAPAAKQATMSEVVEHTFPAFYGDFHLPPAAVDR